MLKPIHGAVTQTQPFEHAAEGFGAAPAQECVASASMLPAAALAAGRQDRRLTPREEAKLLAPLLRLRQACCHPQVLLSYSRLHNM